MATEIHSRKYVHKCVAALIVLLVVGVVQVGSVPNPHNWKNISRPEKIWSVFHPFKAKKVLECAQRSRFVTDSLEKAGVLTDPNGGQLDAFRHAYWMALMVNRGMRENVVLHVGERHERGNYLDFRKGKTEDSLRPDSMMCVMDLSNNSRGVTIGSKYKCGDKKISLIETILNDLQNGNLYIMLKNEKGQYLDKDRKPIDLTLYKNQWYIPKVLVSSDMIDIEH